MEGCFLLNPLTWLENFNDPISCEDLVEPNVNSTDCDFNVQFCDGPLTPKHLLQPNTDQFQLSFTSEDDDNRLDDCSIYTTSCDQLDYSTNTDINNDGCIIELSCKQSINTIVDNKKSIKPIDHRNSTICPEEDGKRSVSTEVSCLKQESQEKFDKKRNRKCNLPQWDPEIKDEWYQKPMSAIETLSYTVGVFSDLLSPDLAECWTEQLGRQVELPEKLEIMSVTQNEMDQMRKNYSDSVKTKQSFMVELPMKSSSTNVSTTACLSSYKKEYRSPYINAIIGQMNKKNLKSIELLLDSGSDINLVSIDTLKECDVELSNMENVPDHIVLRGSTGALKNPFVGLLKTKIRFWMPRKMLTTPKTVDFHVLKAGSSLKVPILGISFLRANKCSLNFSNDTFKIRNNEKLISIPTNDKTTRFSFFLSHDQSSGNCLVQCTCNVVVSAPIYCSVPEKYIKLLDTNVVRLQPGTISKNANKSRLYSQTFCFEINLQNSMKIGELVLELDKLYHCKNAPTANSKICNYEILEQPKSLSIYKQKAKVIVKGFFGVNINSIKKYCKGYDISLLSKTPKNRCLLKHIEAELSIKYCNMNRNFEPKVKCEMQLSSQERKYGPGIPRMRLDCPCNPEWQKLKHSVSHRHETGFPIAFLYKYQLQLSKASRALTPSCRILESFLSERSNKDENPYEYKIKINLNQIFITLKKKARMPSSQTTLSRVHPNVSCNHTDLWVRLWKPTRNCQDQRVDLHQQIWAEEPHIGLEAIVGWLSPPHHIALRSVIPWLGCQQMSPNSEMGNLLQWHLLWQQLHNKKGSQHLYFLLQPWKFSLEFWSTFQLVVHHQYQIQTESLMKLRQNLEIQNSILYCYVNLVDDDLPSPLPGEDKVKFGSVVKVQIKAIPSDNVDSPRQMNESNIAINGCTQIDESNILQRKDNKGDASDKTNIPNGTKSRQCNGSIQNEAVSINLDDEAHSHGIRKKKMYLPQFSSAEDEAKINEELTCTGLEAPKNKILSQKLSTVSEELNGLMERQSIDLPEVKEFLEVKHLNKDIQCKIKQIENEFKSSFSTETKRTGCFNQFLYDIPLDRLPKPLADKRRYYEPETVTQVSETLDLLMKEKIIDEATDPQVICNLLPVEKSIEGSTLGSKIDKYLNKKNNKLTNKKRAVVDVRMLNSLLPTPNVINLPKINEIKSKLNNHFLSSLDICNMFFSIAVTERTSNFLCFYSLKDSRIFRFRRLIQGLKVSPHIASSALKMVLNATNFKTFVDGLPKDDQILLKNLRNCDFERTVHLYVDDVLIASDKSYGIEFHLQILTFVIKYVGAYGFLLSKKKCQILKTQVNFLGVVINSNGFSTMDELRANALANIRSPRSISELSIRLAQIGYYQNYLPQFSKLILPLRQLCKQSEFKWTKTHQNALDSIKMLIKIRFPNYAVHQDKPLFLMSDASKLAISFCLWQISEGKLILNFTESRLLSPQESNKSSVVREAISLVWSLKKVEFIVRSHKHICLALTDCSALVFLSRINSYQPRFLEMSCFISSFPNLQIAHVPGPQIFLADLTTRLYFQFEQRVNSKDEISQLFSKLVPLPPKEMDYKKLDSRIISLYLLEMKRRERIDVFSRETVKFSQNSRYEKALTVEELDKMQQAPVELRYFIKLFWGLDNPTFSQENIKEIKERLDSLPQRLKASTRNSPNLSDAFLKLREDPNFVKEMIEVITRKINDGNDCQQPVVSSQICTCLHSGQMPEHSGQMPDINKRFYICTNDHDMICHGEISNQSTYSHLPSTSDTIHRLTKSSVSRENKVSHDSLSAHITRETATEKEANWSKAVEAVFTLASCLGIKYPEGSGIAKERQIFEILFRISSNLNENWVRILNREAILVPYAILQNFILHFDAQERVFTIQTNADILLAKQRKTVVILDLFINLNCPLEVVDTLEEKEDLVSFAQLVTQHLMKNIESLEILNLSMTDDMILKKGTIILKLQPIFPLILPVFLIKESSKELQQVWCESVASTSVLKQRQMVRRLAYCILPVLKKMNSHKLDIRNPEIQTMYNNNLCIVRTYHNDCSNWSIIHPTLSQKKHITRPSGEIKEPSGTISQVSCQNADISIMSRNEREVANKILLLQFIQKGFAISPSELIQIQSSDPEIKKMVRRDKNNKFETYNGVVFHRNDVNNTTRTCLVLPEYIAKLVLRELHVVKMLHLSSKQMSKLFSFTFFTRNLIRHSQEVSQECLHCTCNFLKKKNSSHLGERKLFPVLMPNQVWVLDTLAMPTSLGYSFLSILCDEGSGYITLYPMRACTMNEVQKCLYQHLCNFPAFSVLKSDYGTEYQEQITEFLSKFDIIHYSSIVRRSESQGLSEVSNRMVRSHLKRLISSLGLNRDKWVTILPYVSKNLNSTEIHNTGLSRVQLLFSPLVQANGLQIDSIFNHQMQMYKKIFENRDRILKNRQEKFNTLNTKFTVGALVFRLDEKGPREISHPKQLPSSFDLYMITHIPAAPKNDSNHIRTSESSFKIFIKNLRSGVTSVTHSANLRRVTVNEFAHFGADLFNKFNATLKRLGNITPGVTPRLNLLGLEETGQQAATTDDQANNVMDPMNLNPIDSVPDAFETEYSRPSRAKKLPTKYRDYDMYVSQISLNEERLFLTQNYAQRTAILRALRLHLSICPDCVKKNTYEYLLNAKLEMLPQLLLPLKGPKKATKGKRVLFDKKIKNSDNTISDLKSYCLIVEPTKLDRERAIFDFDISIKELTCLTAA